MNSIPPNATRRYIQATEFTPTSALDRSHGLQFNPFYLAIGALLLLALTIAWFLVAARSLIITPTPANAAIEISGGFSFRIGDNYLLLPGEYLLRATHPEYKTLEQTLAINDDNVQTVAPELQPLPGKLWVTTEPESDAEIYLDEQLLGSSGQWLEAIEAGPHQYLVTSERFQDARGEVDIIGRKQEQKLSVTLQPAWADITLTTVPEGANIVLDEQLLATTPATVELLAGDRELSLQKEGYKIKTYPLTVIAQTAQDLGVIELEKIDGLLTIGSTPAGAGVTVNGQYVGQTPLSAPVTPGERIQVYLSKDGYQAATRALSITSGETISISVDLQAVLGQVTVKAKPEDALLYIDGRLSGRANQTVQLPAKQHQLKITREGYADFTTTVLPRPGLTQSLSPALKTLEEAKWEHVKDTVTTATGQKLKLFRPEVKFQMGSSRREQGRRANEAQRNIELSRAFYLAPLETTNQQYRQFQRSHSSSHVGGNSLDNDDNPVVNVSWLDAALFCNWLSKQEGLPEVYQVTVGKLTGFDPQATGYRLPTEAEWAWASRYKAGQMLKYSWGPSLPPPAKADNIADRSAASLLGTIQASYDDGFAVTAPVGQFKVNHNGLYDINGNAAEWIHDFYMIKTGLMQEVELDPMGPLEGDYHVIRGASWSSGGISDLRLSFRDYGNDAKNTVGFRIARYVE